MSRETMLELRTRNVPVSEYPKFWRFNAMKVDIRLIMLLIDGLLMTLARKKSNCITRHFTVLLIAPGELFVIKTFIV